MAPVLHQWSPGPRRVRLLPTIHILGLCGVRRGSTAVDGLADRQQLVESAGRVLLQMERSTGFKLPFY